MMANVTAAMIAAINAACCIPTMRRWGSRPRRRGHQTAAAYRSVATRSSKVQDVKHERPHHEDQRADQDDPHDRAVANSRHHNDRTSSAPEREGERPQYADGGVHPPDQHGPDSFPSAEHNLARRQCPRFSTPTAREPAIGWIPESRRGRFPERCLWIRQQRAGAGQGSECERATSRTLGERGLGDLGGAGRVIASGAVHQPDAWAVLERLLRPLNRSAARSERPATTPARRHWMIPARHEHESTLSLSQGRI